MSCKVYSFWVDCPPAPEPRARSRAVVTPTSTYARVYRPRGTGRNAKPGEIAAARWREAVAAEARRRIPEPITGPVEFSLTVWIQRPKSHFLKSGALTKAAPEYPYSAGDFDNFEKGPADAMKGIAWIDDGRVVDSDFHKRYASPGNPVGGRITITEKRSDRR